MFRQGYIHFTLLLEVWPTASAQQHACVSVWKFPKHHLSKDRIDHGPHWQKRTINACEASRWWFHVTNDFVSFQFALKGSQNIMPTACASWEILQPYHCRTGFWKRAHYVRLFKHQKRFVGFIKAFSSDTILRKALYWKWQVCLTYWRFIIRELTVEHAAFLFYSTYRGNRKFDILQHLSLKLANVPWSILVSQMETIAGGTDLPICISKNKL